ncbi:MAG: hypothetical protein ABIS86_01780 [Streptosporangiaceae bacterium]
MQFRLTERQRNIYRILGAVWAVIALIRLFISPASGIFTLFVAALFFGYYFLLTRFGLDVTEQGVTLRGWQTTTYAWNQVQSVEPTLFWFQRRVLLKFTDGTSRRPWAPMHYFSMPDPDFGAKVHGIQQWHTSYFHAQPAFGAPAPQQQQYGQPGPQQYGQPAPQQQPYSQPPYSPPPAAPQQTPGEWTQVFGAGGADPHRPQ